MVMLVITQAAADEMRWYHTFDLPGGVVTRGLFDLRPLAPQLPMPLDLTGMRCLDAASSDGFWGFEMARRGASEVVSLDLADVTKQDFQHPGRALPAELPTASRADLAFHTVRTALGADNVHRVDMSVHDVTTEDVGTFDYVFMGNILVHLSDPAAAVRAISRVLRDDAELLSIETFSIALTLLSRRRPVASFFTADTRGADAQRNDFNRWWLPNMSGHRALVAAGGVAVVQSGGPVFQKVGAWRARRPTRVPRDLREAHFVAVVRPFGVPTSWVRAVRE